MISNQPLPLITLRIRQSRNTISNIAASSPLEPPMPLIKTRSRANDADMITASNTCNTQYQGLTTENSIQLQIENSIKLRMENFIKLHITNAKFHYITEFWKIPISNRKFHSFLWSPNTCNTYYCIYSG